MRQFLSLLAVIAAVTVPLLITGLSSEPPASAGSGGITVRQLAAEVPAIARGVERTRDLRYRRIPKPHIIRAARLAQLSTGEEGHKQKAAMANAEEELKMLGLIGPHVSLANFDQAVAGQTIGAYDPQRKRLYVIGGPSAENGAIVRITLAHELDHALEDQRFGLPDEAAAGDDRGLAEQALVEGSATELMTLYAERYINPAALLKAIADPQLFASTGPPLPKVLQADLEFSYFRGQKLVQALRRLSGRWNLVNIAFRDRPPLSTEQVMHPYKYLTYERPLPVRLRARAILGSGWHPLGSDDLGEFDTFQLLGFGNPDAAARAAAAGWGGQRTQLWRRGKGGCPAPCRARDALIAAWRWDSGPDRRQFDRAARAYVERGLGGEPRTPSLWSLPGGWVALAGGGTRSTIAFAPRPSLAERLATAQGPGTIAAR
jgi:hypothetical protein